MKRIFISLLLIAFMMILLISCSQNYHYSVLEVGGYDYLQVDDNHMEEISLRDVKYEDSTVVQNKNVYLNGNNYVMEYQASQKGYLYRSDYDCYRQVDNENIIDVSINRETGRIDRYIWGSKNYLDGKVGSTLTEEECLVIAQSYLRSFIDDVSKYEVIETNYFDIPEFQAVYQFRFNRTISDLKTSDEAYISVSVYGDVTSHLFKSLGEMRDAIKLPSSKEMKYIQSNVEDKIQTIYNSVTNNFDFTYRIDDVVFTKLEDGKYALDFYIVVTLTSKNTLVESKEIVETTRLLVCLV